MTSIALHTPPRGRTIAMEQLRLTGLRLRAAGVMLIAIYAGVLALLANSVARIAESMKQGGQQIAVNYTFSPEISRVVALVACLVAIGVWQDEEPSRRVYLWTMPIRRETHTFLRVGAGWIWVMFIGMIYLVGVQGLVAVTEGMTGHAQRYHEGFAWWEWLVPFTAATVAYLLASAAAVWSRRPAVWIFGVPALYALLSMMGGMFRLVTLDRALVSLARGRYGVEAAMGGTIFANIDQSANTTPDAARWLITFALWAAASLALLWWLASRRPRSG